MARRDGYSRGLESLEEIRASDRFIEQLRVSGTYEPSTRTDAALAAALLTWRDEARLDPLNPPPSADEVDIDVYAQPRRIARRAVAVAATMLALSSAAATALDGDPLKPVRFLVDLGVNVGERIATPSSSESSSSGESPAEILPDGEGLVPPWAVPTQPDPETPPRDDRRASTALIGPNDLVTHGNPGTDLSAPPSVTSSDDAPAQDEGEITDGDAPSTDATEDPTGDPSDTPTPADEGQDNDADHSPPGGPSDNDNGHANGHANDPNGHANDPNGNGGGGSNANGHANDPNGNANGHANGHANDPNGNANGHANGHANDPSGNANGQANDPKGNAYGQSWTQSDDAALFDGVPVDWSGFSLR